MADNLNTMGVDDADVDDGLTTLAGKILNVVPAKTGTVLEIDIASLNLVYGDDFNITGSLTDDDNNGVCSASVKLLVGSTVVDTQITDSSGDVTFTYCPVATGTHTFKLVYEGDCTYEGCTSSTVTRTVNKETTYLSVNGASSVTVYTDESYSVSGSLMDNDSTPQPVAGKSIVVVESGRTVAILTTASDGSFSGNISCTDLGGIGSHTVTFNFAGDSNYTASVVQRTVVVHSTSLSLVSDKSILSYADGESATLTATYVGGSVEGLTVSFKAYKGGTLVEDIGSDTTDSSGVASVSYSSKGAGDLSIECECMNLQETYSIGDCLKYDSGASDNTSKYDTTYSTGQTFSHDSTENAYKIQRTSQGFGTVLVDNLTVANNVEMSYMLKITSSTSLNAQPTLSLFNENGSGVGIRSGYTYDTKYFILSDTEYDDFGTIISRDDYNSFSQNTWYRVVLSHNNGTVTAKLYDTNDNLLKSITGSVNKFNNNSNKVGVLCDYVSGVTICFKELKVKPL